MGGLQVVHARTRDPYREARFVLGDRGQFGQGGHHGLGFLGLHAQVSPGDPREDVGESGEETGPLGLEAFQGLHDGVQGFVGLLAGAGFGVVGQPDESKKVRHGLRCLRN